MIKIVALIKRRPDLTLEEFCTYYEQRHAPLFVNSIPPDVSDAIIHYGRTTQSVSVGARRILRTTV